ncbi:disease resistance protein At4g27190-like [Rhododendron vialii]|uniref:disease resistance protein At4g27190-like n=1 Tax=Rhododendron vialii TaxID=182163 RepID=UPI00265D9D45|nr:disease resistance protein At4g27190-like [Rhododendron vialii]
MCSPTIVLDKIVEKIVDKVFEPVGRRLSYLFHYKQNMKDLEVEMNKLQKRRTTIKGQIDEAKTSGDVILDNVSEWLNGAERLRQGVDTFMEEKTVKENVQCFKFSCPNFISWYKLSKEAEKKMGDVRSLYEEGNFGTNIARRAPPPPELQFPSSGAYISFDSRELVFKRIMEALTDSKVNVIGVYGTGGVGKTTMVERVGEQVKKDGLFDEVVMAVVSQDVNVTKIQEVLADRLGLKLEAKTEVGKAYELWNRLNNGKRNLVILDDTWKKLNLKEIGLPITDGNESCKVVLTSRNQRVFKDMDVHKDFPIEVLSEEEAWNLFKKKMGNSGESNDQLHDIANAVCKECQGLPVAILAVATALKDKSMDDWKSSLDKLQKSMLNDIEDIDPNLFKSLKLSYDYLKSKDAKSCFLLCCLFPEDAQVPIEELASHCLARRLLCQEPTTLEKARVIVCSVVNTLKTSCLLLDGKNDDFVKMHDIVRDVAILIAKEEKAFLVKHGVEEWPETGTCKKYLAISLRSETISELPDELVCPELHTLMLGCSSNKFERDTKIPDRFFRGTEKLMVLELDNVSMLPLPSSLRQLTELRMFCLNECKLGDIAILKCLKNKLEVLRLRGSDIKALPPEVGELTRLRLLDLGHCKELNVIPNGVISKLYRLEVLRFPRGFENWEGTTGNEEISKVSLDELMPLTLLSTLDIHIPHPRMLPRDLEFQNLIRFNITVGATRYYDSEDYSEVVLRGIDIDDDFNILERLLGKPGRGGLYPSRSFNNLTQLYLDDCRLKYLFSPSCARELLQLQSLQIWESEIMEAVIGNEGEKDEEIIANVINFSKLKSLKLHGLPRLISFYPRIKKATIIESHYFPPTQSLFNAKVSFVNITFISNVTVKPQLGTM